MSALPQRPVDRSWQVPAAPSPGSSAKRARLSDSDRKRIDQEIKARQQGQPSKPERVGVRLRFTQGDEEWAILEDGSYWVFLAGPFERGAIVTARTGPLAGRRGVIRAIDPGWGGAVAINVAWEKVPGELRRPKAFWTRDELVVIGHAARTR
jgi:hypothetical protein